MEYLSAIFYFLSQHSILAMPVILLFGFIVLSWISRWRNNWGCMTLMIGVFVAAILNVFMGSAVNGIFLNAVGTRGSAVITHAEETNSQLNDQNIWVYDVVMKTADGRDVKTGFDTMSASIYPWTNAIYIPSVGDRFVVKYVPGFEKNIAIMREESDYGKRIIVGQAMGEVSAKERQLDASPDNPEFKAEYRAALVQFLDSHADNADPAVVKRYRDAVLRLDGKSPVNEADPSRISGANPVGKAQPADCEKIMPPEMFAAMCKSGQCNCTSSTTTITTQSGTTQIKIVKQ